MGVSGYGLRARETITAHFRLPSSGHLEPIFTRTILNVGFATPAVLLPQINSIWPKSWREFLAVIVSRALTWDEAVWTNASRRAGATKSAAITCLANHFTSHFLDPDSLSENELRAKPIIQVLQIPNDVFDALLENYPVNAYALDSYDFN